jgi:glycosyltransferase involved in cell wall biosynthesis
MNKFDQTICLSMIVKNEAHVIRRCIDSVRPIIDHWVIVDTGSTDGTQDVIRAAMADLPGKLHERPWVDFAFNRSEALRLARPKADYSLIIDADDTLIIPNDFEMPRLTEAGYRFTILDEGTQYHRVQLVSNKMKWRYRGKIHEFAECPGNPPAPTLPLAMTRGDDGARHRDGETELRDLAVLKDALAVEKDPSMIARYTFYLARSYRDTGQEREALACYLKRAEQGYWDQEIYLSLLNAARLMETLGEPPETILSTYDRVIALMPARAEARHSASQFCRRSEDYVTGYRYAEAGVSLPEPPDGLAVNPWIYAYGMRDELSIHAFRTGQYRACLAACLSILGQTGVPESVVARACTLARLALQEMVAPGWSIAPIAYSAEFTPAWGGS